MQKDLVPVDLCIKGVDRVNGQNTIAKSGAEQRLGNLYGMDGGNYAGNVYNQNGLCPALLSMQGGGGGNRT